MAGDDANPGTSEAAPRRTLTGFNVNALPAGSRILFAKGGAWSNFRLVLHNANVTTAQPLVIDSYTPSWGGSAKPLIRAATRAHPFEFGMYAQFMNDGGYTIRNLKVQGDQSPDSWGFYMHNNVHDVLLENNEITGFTIGVHIASAEGGRHTAVTLRNNHIHRNVNMGLLVDGHDMVIEGNLIEANNFTGTQFAHGVYLAGSGSNTVVRNNTFLNNSVASGVCSGGNLTVHGRWDGLLIEGNRILQEQSAGGCYGISVNPGYATVEYFRRLVVRGNVVSNLGYCSICVTSAPGVVVENNLLINSRATEQAAIRIPDRTPGAGDDLDTGAIIRNNTIVFERAAQGSTGVSLSSGAGTQMQVVSNLVWFGSESNANHTCFSPTARSNFEAFDNNLCHHAGGNGRWSSVYANLVAARNAGFDVNGLSVDPLLVTIPSASNDWNDALQAGSPAMNAGHATRSSTVDRLGRTRSVPDIGARELP